ncbi:cysteine-rich RLK (RECEPTOR-like protein kinase) 8 [Hibiscus trionum]|uniref:Cysteine-rich RLK (RECEPTOR-like protein kinase) 8 n=1 Tax=Hibiscus trionum TaxID=183268 RepID=A0A9W7MTS4_HIBTR|nr:cysteine-rich RLK (RECEPTOR-like protein kinase) 8 [Hibiscus trionum]
MNQPKDVHWRAVKRILRYLQGTLHYGIVYTARDNCDLVCYSDADWAALVEDRRSTTGYCIYLGGNPITWCSKKKSVVSRSSFEAEYRSLANSVSELMWIESLLAEIGVVLTRLPVVWCDNTSTVSMAANPTHHARVKHVKIDIHFVRERVLAGQLIVNFVPFSEQIVDILTKSLPRDIYTDLRSRLGVTSTVQVQEEEETMRI